MFKLHLVWPPAEFSVDFIVAVAWISLLGYGVYKIVGILGRARSHRRSSTRSGGSSIAEYDSAGIATLENGARPEGAPAASSVNLEARLAAAPLSGNAGIGRHALGRPTERRPIFERAPHAPIGSSSSTTASSRISAR